jgi:hypothetical protein
MSSLKRELTQPCPPSSSDFPEHVAVYCQRWSILGDKKSERQSPPECASYCWKKLSSKSRTKSSPESLKLLSETRLQGAWKTHHGRG